MHFFGFDIDASPGAAYEDISDILEPLRTHDAAARILARLARVPGETLDEEISRLDDVINLLDSARDLLLDLLCMQRATLLSRFANALRDSFRYIQMAFPAADWPSLNRAMAYRETLMHRNVADAIADSSDASKVVLMSHDLHLARNYGLIKGNIGAGPGGGTVDALGTFLNHRAPDDIYSVWMLCNRGRDSQPFSFCTRDIKPVDGSFNSILAEIGSAFVLPLDGIDHAARLLLNPELPVRMDGNTQVRTPIARQADAIVFIDQVSPLRS